MTDYFKPTAITVNIFLPNIAAVVKTNLLALGEDSWKRKHDPLNPGLSQRRDIGV